MVERLTVDREVLGSNTNAPSEMIYRHFRNNDGALYWERP